MPNNIILDIIPLVSVLHNIDQFCAYRQRPSYSMLNSSWTVNFRSNRPQLLDTDAVRLSLVVGVQAKSDGRNKSSTLAVTSQQKTTKTFPHYQFLNSMKRYFIDLLVYDLFGKLTAATLSEYRALCVELHSAFKVFFWSSVLAHSDVSGGDTLDTAILVEENFRGGKT